MKHTCSLNIAITVSIDALKCIIPIVPKLGQQFSVVGIVDKGY